MSQLVAIVNVTPDSFSDGGDYEGEEVLERVQDLIDDGANVIDVGAESTRPGAEPIDFNEEFKRLSLLLPEIVGMAHANGVEVSVDTRHPSTARWALEEDVDWINDVTGLRNEEMRRVLADATCPIVVMHSLSVPVVKDEVLPEDADVETVFVEWLEDLLETTEEAGIARERLIVDPGLGFGKTPRQTLELIQAAGRLRQLGLPLLYGHSRKSFMSLFSDGEPFERDELTCAFSAMLALHGVEYLRVHDVASHKAMLDAL